MCASNSCSSPSANRLVPCTSTLNASVHKLVLVHVYVCAGLRIMNSRNISLDIIFWPIVKVTYLRSATPSLFQCPPPPQIVPGFRYIFVLMYLWYVAMKFYGSALSMGLYVVLAKASKGYKL